MYPGARHGLLSAKGISVGVLPTLRGSKSKELKHFPTKLKTGAPDNPTGKLHRSYLSFSALSSEWVVIKHGTNIIDHFYE